jgi:seryl-tRNA synthetase
MENSLMKKIAELIKSSDSSDQNNHLLIMVELDNRGLPVGNIIQAKGNPYEVLGMGEIINSKLTQIKASVMDKFEKVEKLSNELESLPDDLKTRFKDFTKLFDEAVAKGDADAMKELLKFLSEEESKDNSDKKSDKGSDYDIDFNDFKNLF